MIAKLSGLVDSVGEDWAVIDVAGVGYLAYCSARTLRSLPERGQSARLYIETHVREDHIHLYGFADTVERNWFRLLLGVQGVGARLALAILSALSPAELMQAVAAQDKALLARASGVGARLAQRIVGELRDKVTDVRLGPVAAVVGETATDGLSSDAVSALVNLGYARAEAFGAVSLAARELGEGATVEALIRRGLKELAR